MGYWLPPLVQAVKQQDFFKIPQTKVFESAASLAAADQDGIYVFESIYTVYRG